MSHIGLAVEANATRSCLATTAFAEWMLEMDKEHGGNGGTVRYGSSTIVTPGSNRASSKDGQSRAFRSRQSLRTPRTRPAPLVEREQKTPFQPLSSPFSRPPNAANTHLWSHDPHITASSAQHTSVAGFVVHTSQKVFMARSWKSRVRARGGVNAPRLTPIKWWAEKRQTTTGQSSFI